MGFRGFELVHSSSFDDFAVDTWAQVLQLGQVQSAGLTGLVSRLLAAESPGKVEASSAMLAGGHVTQNHRQVLQTRRFFAFSSLANDSND